MALSANRERHYSKSNKLAGSALGADSQEFYEGQLLMYTPAASTVQPAADTSGGRIAGVCTKRVTTGSSNTTEIPFEFCHLEWFPIAASSLAAGDEGLDAVIADDGTLGEAADESNDVRAGRIYKLETIKGVAGAWIQVAVHGPSAA